MVPVRQTAHSPTEAPRTAAAATSAAKARKAGGEPGNRILCIDGLRGLACLAVLLVHIPGPNPERWGVIDVAPGHLPAWSVNNLVQLGYSGVELFFVLSGFCLAIPILSRPDRVPDWAVYAHRRAWRILPPYWACVLLIAGLGLLARRLHADFLITPTPHETQSPLAVLPVRQLFVSLALIGVRYCSLFWTLVLEARWYFVFPLLLTLQRYLRRRLGGGGAILLLLTLPVAAVFRAMYVTHSPAAQRLSYAVTDLPLMLPLFALGMWAAEIQAETQRESPSATGFAVAAVNAALRRYCIAGLGAAFVAAVVCRDLLLTRYEGASQGEPAKVAVWGALYFFLLLSALYNTAFRRVLSWRPLVAAGGISYSLYLIHLPLIEAARLLVPPTSLPTAGAIGFYYLAVPAICIGLARLFFQAFERPFLTPPITLKRAASNGK